MVKNPHIIWVCPSSKMFYRAKGEVHCRPGSVVPKLSEQGYKVNILIPHDPSLLPKTKLSPSRVTKHNIHLAQDFPVEIIKLTRGSISPGVYMVKMPTLEPALASAVFSKTAMALAKQLKRPVDIFHMFGWEASLLPLYLEMEKNGSKIFKETRTFLNIDTLKDQGNFAPAIMAYLGVPEKLFHPEGIEFYGKVSYLKTGLLFSDGVGLVEGRPGQTSKNGLGLEGVLDSVMYKLRRWASERSYRSHLDAYRELLSLPKSKPFLPQLMERLHETTAQAQDFIKSWGPLPPDKYGVNAISFLAQAPHKAYAFWEWTRNDHREYGLFLEDLTNGTRHLLSRGLTTVNDYWIEVFPDREYLVELVGWTDSGEMQPLLRSRPLRIPRVCPSPNTRAIFVDVKSRHRFTVTDTQSWDDLLTHLRRGATSAWEWAQGVAAAAGLGLPASLNLPSSHNLPSSFQKDKTK